jgi:hypothetical protein
MVLSVVPLGARFGIKSPDRKAKDAALVTVRIMDYAVSLLADIRARDAIRRELVKLAVDLYRIRVDNIDFGIRICPLREILFRVFVP